MKRIISIFFLTLFLLYHVGYLGFYWISLKQINQEWLNKMEYSGVTLKVSIPITLPYWNDQSEYKPTTGSINVDGKVYRKIMQKYAQDAIHLILVEDSLTQNLNQSISDWVKAMTDPGAENSGKKALYSLAKDYLKVAGIFMPEAAYLIRDLKHFSYNTIFKSVTLDIPTPPPQG